MTAADRIAQLEAELADERKTLAFVRETARIATDQCDALRAAHARTQAEAAAMREEVLSLAIRWAQESKTREELVTNLQLELAATRAASPAGRAVAERVPLWRELEDLATGVNKSCDWIVKSGHVDDEHDPDCASCKIDDVLGKLAALDEKGGGQ